MCFIGYWGSISMKMALTYMSLIKVGE